ncbi:transcription termination factor Rho, partial [Bifidobacterium sp. DSM 109958]
SAPAADAPSGEARPARRVRRKAVEIDIDLPAPPKTTSVRTDRRPRRDQNAAPASGDAKQAPGDLFEVLGIDENAARAPRKAAKPVDDEPLQLPRRRRRDHDVEPRENEHGNVRDLDDILATLPSRKDDNGDDDFDRRSRRDRSDRRDRNGRNDRNDRDERRNRRDRNGRDDRRNRDERDYDRDDRADRRDDYQSQQDDLVPVAGIVDVLDSYAFVRTSGYLPGPNDVYISMGQVKKYGLRKGDAVHGAIRAPRDNDRRNQRQKFVPLQSIDSINGMSVEEAANRPQFAKLTPLYPQERLKQETTPSKITGRIMDIVSPIGKGQRGLIVSPPKAGKTITLQNIANSIATNNPEVHLMVVLVDERPEEVTDMERTVQGEVISSTFDRPASDHTTVAELAIERAKRLVELGQDVVVLLDSMTRLARAYNIAAPASGRILSGGVDAQALYPPKKFFGAARNIENGGSLTIISSALVETGSKMDEVIFEEFKGTGNMELRLSRELADKRLFPAIDINASGTRREELITPPAELAVIYGLRRALGGMEPEQAYQTLVPRLKKTPTNRDFLAAITSTLPQNK